MTANAPDAEAFARRLLAQTVGGLVAFAASVAFVVLVGALCSGGSTMWSVAFTVVFGLSGVMTILLSVNLVFDALLFRLIASHASEAEGCAAVDDVLARMRLKPRPARLRGIQERVAGTRRVMRHQLMALGGCIAASLALWLTRAA